MRTAVPQNPADATQAPHGIEQLMAGCLSDYPLDALRRIDREGLWEYVAAQACDMRIGGVLLNALLYHHVDIPASAERQMRAYRDHVAAANDWKTQSAQRVLARLQMAKIPFLLLKGAALNATVYATAGLRPMTDLDVLIRPCDADAAHRVLSNAGCEPGADLVRPDFYPRFYYEREYFTRRHPAVKIDLHCRPFRMLRYARTVPDNAMWNDAREVRFGDLTVSIPGPEQMLIHLCVHAACHGGTELRWLYDIKRWLDVYGERINPDSFADKCARWELSLAAHRALTAVRSFFPDDDNGPLSAILAATDRRPWPLERLTLAAAPLGKSAPGLYNIANLLTVPGVRFRLAYLAAILIPGQGHLAQLYARRHPGWPLVAHAIRIGRCLRRPFAGTTTATA